MEKYLVLSPDGSMSWIRTPHEKILEAFHEAIGCDCLEHVNLPFGFGCVVDESGKIKANPQPLNPYASVFYPGSLYGDPLVGPVVFVRIGMYHGEPDWQPLTDQQVYMIERILGKQVPQDG